MEIAGYLKRLRDEIVKDAVGMLSRSRLKHYDESSQSENRQRIEQLFDLSVECAATRNLVSIIEYSENIARERHKGGFDFHEVHSAYNVLEEAFWQKIIQDVTKPAELAEALGVISTVIGAGKEALASAYINLSVKTKITDFDLSGFTGRK
jgi:hypothetical protein